MAKELNINYGDYGDILKIYGHKLETFVSKTISKDEINLKLLKFDLTNLISVFVNKHWDKKSYKHPVNLTYNLNGSYDNLSSKEFSFVVEEVVKDKFRRPTFIK